MTLKRRRAAALVMIAALIMAALSGCSGGGADINDNYYSGGSYGGGMTYQQAAQPVNPYADIIMGIVTSTGAVTSPLLAAERDIVSLNKLVYESLVELSEDMKPTHLLADRWTQEGKVWTFHLRSGIFFHNGMPLTAYDVLDSYTAIMGVGQGNPYYNVMNNFIESMEVIDDLTLNVTARNSYFSLYAMTFPVMQRNTIFDGRPMGTGMMWYIENNVNSYILLERNPRWWKQLPAVERLTVYRFNEAKDLMEAFESGRIGLLATKSNIAALSDDLSDRSTVDFSTHTYEMLLPNHEDSVLSDVEVRRAIMYAIDIDTLASTVYLDMVQKSEVPVAPGSWLYEPQSAIYNYNPEQALKILYDSGWSDTNSDGILDRVKDNSIQDLAFQILTYNEPTHSTRYDAAMLIAEQLRRIGMNVTVVRMSKANVSTQLKEGEFDMALIANELSDVPDLYFMFHSQGTGNRSRYASEAMDTYINDARNATTEGDLSSAMSKIQMLTAGELPVLGLFFRTGRVVADFSLSGLAGPRDTDMLRGLEFLGEGY